METDSDHQIPEFELQINRDVARRGLNIELVASSGLRTTHIVEWLINDTVLQGGERVWAPVTREQLQTLADALREAGILAARKPNDVVDYTEELRASHEKHVADLHDLVFNPDTVSIPRALMERMCGMLGEPEGMDPEAGYEVTHAVGFHDVPESREPRSGMDPMFPDGAPDEDDESR